MTDCITKLVRGRWADWFKDSNHLETSRPMWLATGARVLKIYILWCNAAQKPGWPIFEIYWEARVRAPSWHNCWAISAADLNVLGQERPMPRPLGLNKQESSA